MRSRRERSTSPVPGPAGRALLAAFVLALPTLAPLGAAADPALAAGIDRRVREAAGAVPALAVHVVDLASGEEVYGREVDRALIPASNQKLLTTAAALHRLGPGYFFETPLGIQGRVEDGVLHGDLGVRGGGDPNISGRFYGGDPYGALRAWGERLRARGIERVRGDLLLEHGLFSGPLVHPDWPPEQLAKWYEAPVAALSFADNVFTVRAWGAAAAGRPAIVDAAPFLPLERLRNGVRTSAARSASGVRVLRAPHSPVVEVHGSLPRHGAAAPVAVTVLDPVAYFGEALRQALARSGVVIEGEVRAVERLPGPWWELVHVHRSSLLPTLDVINKRSQNFYAESVYKLLGAHQCRDGSWEGGGHALESFLTGTVGWQAGSFTVRDGSGMSRHNRLTARQLTDLLGFMHRHRWGRVFLESLPHSGERGGSLHKRLDRPPHAGNVFAKTGTLENVSTLSGYAKGRSGRLYAFSILCNNAPVWRGRQVQDRIVGALVENG